MIHIEEAIGVLDLIKNITERIQHINNGEIVIFTDNRRLINEYNK